MSGPKVVRVVTKEERIATCEKLLAQLQAALDDWEAVARRCAVSDTDLQRMRAREVGLRAALATDRFDEIERNTNTETLFVRGDIERLHALHVAREAALRRIRKRAHEADPALRDLLQRELSGKEDSMSEEQHAIADSLKGGLQVETFAQWLAQHPSIEDSETAQLEQKLAELSILIGEKRIAQFEARIPKIEQTQETSRRRMLLDTLSSELAQAVREACDRAAQQARLRTLAAELRALHSAGAVHRATSVILAIDGESAALTVLEAEIHAALAAEREAFTAHVRRNAVLAGLASLGYAVNDGLETAWVKDGRVVVSRPSQPGYGVEFGGKAASGRIQARVVAIGDANHVADSIRDHDAETLWCSDFSRLQEAIAANGGGLTIERALGVGATPLKLVTAVESESGYAADVPSQRERTLREP